MDAYIHQIMDTFRHIQVQFQKINDENILPSFEEGLKITNLLKRYRSQYYGLDDRRKILAKTEISYIESMFSRPRSKFTALTTVKWENEDRSIRDVLVSLFSECDRNLFGGLRKECLTTDDLTVNYQIIMAFLQTCNSIDFQYIWGNDTLSAIMEVTEEARKLINDYIKVNENLSEKDEKSRLHLLELSYHFAFLYISYDFNSLHAEMDALIDWENRKASEQSLIDIAVRYMEKYYYWMSASNRYGNHKNELQAYIINRYCDIFDYLDIIRNTKGLITCLLKSTSDVSLSIAHYVSWRKSQPTGSLSELKEYGALAQKCKNFSRVELYNIYSQQAEFIVMENIGSANSNNVELHSNQIRNLVIGYQNAFCAGFDLCADTNDRELIAENVDLFYALYTEIGVHLNEREKQYLCIASRPTLQTIEKLRAMHYPTESRITWKKADLFFQEVSLNCK